MSLSSYFLILLLVLSLPLIRCCCSFFSICHFSYLYLQFSYPYMLHFLCEFSCFQLLLSIPDMINLLWYIYYSQISTHPRCLNLMIHFSQKLMSTRIFPILSGIVPDEKPFSSFLSLSCFSIIPDNSITSILVSLINLLSCLSFF